MRAALASGTILTCSWSSSRPVWYYHHMAMGHNIGYSAVKSINKDNAYNYVNFGANFPTNQGVHVVLLGDPTLRPFYLTPPTNLLALDDGNGDIALSWNASADPDVTAYNVYRSTFDTTDFKLITKEPVAGTSFTDRNISSDGIYKYIVRGVKLETTASGSYYNESPGIEDSASVVNAVGIGAVLADNKLKIYPNPAVGSIHLDYVGELLEIVIYNLSGQEMNFRMTPDRVNIQEFPKGMYVLRLQTNRGISYARFQKQ